MDNIQVLKPSYRVEECLEAVRECLEAGWTGLGFKTTEFEEAWKKYTGLPHAHFLNSATAGLHLAVKILKDAHGWDFGDEIITTPLTFVSTNHAILYEGMRPVFADIDPNTLCLDVESIEKNITPRTRAVMFVGMAGRPGRLPEIQRLCKQRGLKLILDAAHMAGTKVNDKHVGPEADVAVFSFQSVKNLPTADGGMVCFQDAEFDARARKLSWLGIDKDTYLRSSQAGAYKWRYDVPDLGFKYHGNSIMAAIGLTQLKYLDEDNEARRKIAHQYNSGLSWSSIQTYHSTYLHNNVTPSHHLFQISVDHRDEVLERLNQKGIYPGVHYVDNTQYSMYKYGQGTCPVAHGLSEKLLTLPIHLEMTNDDIRRVLNALREIIDAA